MGNTWTVEVWGEWFPGRHCSREVWQGESVFGALFAMWRHRNDGSGYISLNYRPTR